MTTNNNVARGEYVLADGRKYFVYGEGEGPAPVGNLNLGDKFFIPQNAVLARGEVTVGNRNRAVQFVGLQMAEGVAIPRDMFVSYFAPRNLDGSAVLPAEPLSKMFSMAPQVGLQKIKGKVVEVVEVLENARTRQRRENGQPMFDENNKPIEEKTGFAYKWTVRDLDPKVDGITAEDATKAYAAYFKANYKPVEPIVEEEE